MEYNPKRYDNIFTTLSPYTRGILERYWSNLKFTSNEYMLDIGCGPGRVTKEVLLPRVENYLENLVAVDVSPEMIQFAKVNYCHPLFSYKEMDFGMPINDEDKQKILPESASDGFDKIFSFYCLMLIQDQRQVAKNILTLLKPGGEALLLVIAKSLAFDMAKGLSENPRWKFYTQDIQQHLSYYQNFEHPERELRHIYETEGLKVNMCAYEKLTIPFEYVGDFIRFMNGLNTFLDRVPEELKSDFVSDSMSALNLSEDQTSAKFKYSVIIVHVSKPKL